MTPIRIASLCFASLFVSLAPAAEVDLQKGDRICFVGNELGERMQHHNFFESLLHQRFADKELAVRNLCFPGDEVEVRIRSKNFGTPDDHLTHSKASVVFYFFGFNESFAGKKGLKDFRTELTELVNHTREQKYDGESNPRVVLISPIAFEAWKDNKHLPDGQELNANLQAYTAAMADVAEATGVGFVDLFTPTKALFESSDAQLTLNGSHLNEAGYEALAPILIGGLFGDESDAEVNPVVNAEVDDKNFHWWHRYRAVNGFSIYGDRGAAGMDGTGTYNNTDVMERERAILDQMTANRDQRIWAVAAGKSVPEEVDDSNTLSFIDPKTNVGGEDDVNRKRGKLGSLEYRTAEEQQKMFVLPEGYQIELVASEEQFPELANPVAIAFDAKGRPWVSTMPSYPHWKPKTELADKVLILEDTDGDSKTDNVKVFADGLHQPTGFEIAGNGVYVAEQPDVLFLQDTDGDDVADSKTRLLVGFDSADSHHGLAAFTFGPGGNLYFQEGTFKYSQVESPYGLTRLAEAGVWKYHPISKRMGAHVSFAFSNPWGHVFDRWGQDFIADASPGENYWAAPISGHIEYPLKHDGGRQHKRTSGFFGGDPKYVFPSFLKKRTRPSAGNELVSSRHFPEEDQGDYLLTNVIGDRCILRHHVEEDGTGFTATEKEPLVSGNDGNFRPVDVEIAPDGSLYIVDWHNALIGHLQHNLRDPSRDHSHGRIWRVTCKDRPLVDPPRIDGATIPELLDNLKLYEDRARYRTRQELAVRDTSEVLSHLENWLAALDPNDAEFEHHRLEALWVYQTHDVVNEDLLRQVLKSNDHRARAAGTRVLSFWVDRIDDAVPTLSQLVGDEHGRVRLEAVRALSFCEGDEAIEAALGVLEHDIDDYTQYTLDETMKALEQ